MSLRTINMPSQHDLVVMAIQKIYSELEYFQWNLDNDAGCNMQQIHARITFLKHRLLVPVYLG